MTKSLAPKDNYSTGNYMTTCGQRYEMFERVVITPQFYMRETHIRSEKTVIQAPTGLESVVDTYQRQRTEQPRVIDASIVNRIAPREKPKAYGAEAGYLRPQISYAGAYAQDRSKQYEMLESNLPNDFYLTPNDLKKTIIKQKKKEHQAREMPISIDLKPLDLKGCERCGASIALGRLCNKCMMFN